MRCAWIVLQLLKNPKNKNTLISHIQSFYDVGGNKIITFTGSNDREQDAHINLVGLAFHIDGRKIFIYASICIQSIMEHSSQSHCRCFEWNLSTCRQSVLLAFTEKPIDIAKQHNIVVLCYRSLGPLLWHNITFLLLKRIRQKRFYNSPYKSGTNKTREARCADVNSPFPANQCALRMAVRINAIAEMVAKTPNSRNGRHSFASLK